MYCSYFSYPCYLFACALLSSGQIYFTFLMRRDSVAHSPPTTAAGAAAFAHAAAPGVWPRGRRPLESHVKGGSPVVREPTPAALYIGEETFTSALEYRGSLDGRGVWWWFAARHAPAGG